MLIAAIAPAALLVLVLLAPVILRGAGTRFGRLHAVARSDPRRADPRARGADGVPPPPPGCDRVRRAALGLGASVVACYILLVALGLDKQAGLPAAAAVLFAVNITAVLPATPANLGVFQAACAAVLHTGWHVGYGTGWPTA